MKPASKSIRDRTDWANDLSAHWRNLLKNSLARKRETKYSQEIPASQKRLNSVRGPVMITVKILCGCGQRYAFDVEPVNGQMPSAVTCPTCGADGTAAANDLIAQSLAPPPESPATPGARLRTMASTTTIRTGSPVPPPLSPATISYVARPTSKLAWYEHTWIALPIALVGIGGAIGGACGGAAWAINKALFKKTENPILRYVWTGLVSASAFATYLVIAALFLSVFKKTGETTASDVYRWKSFTSLDGNFSALFPGEPKEAIQNEIFLKLHSFALEAKKAAFIVSYSDFPEKLHVSPTDRFYNGSRDGAVGKDGKLLQEKSMVIEGFPGREIQFTRKDGNVFVIDRYFLAGNRLFQVITVVPTQDRSSTNIPYFLNSFTMLKK
jgi:hypothetical protein